MDRPPIRSGDPFIDACFESCVEILAWLAELFGVSYYTINIWIFCVIWPVFTVLLIVVVIVQYLKNQEAQATVG